MDPVLLFIGAWWWAAPAAVSAGAVSYGALTTRRRRARRLELDAARHESQVAYRQLVAARARVRAAQADVLSARARRDAPATGIRSVAESKGELQSAKNAERSAALAVRATRTRVKAAQAAYGVRTGDEQLPIERLMTAHDGVVARWLAYETDPELALDYPGMSDATRPTTRAFLEAQREAGMHRPSSARDKITPTQYLAYRDAVRALQITFDAAERVSGAGAGAGASTPRPDGWLSVLDSAAAAWPSVRAAAVDAWPAVRDAATGVWPVPSRRAAPPPDTTK